AAAADAAGHAGVEPVELVEDALARWFRNARAVIGDADADLTAVVADPDVDRQLGRRVLAGVVKHSGERLPEAGAVGAHAGQPCGRLQVDGAAGGACTQRL